MFREDSDVGGAPVLSKDCSILYSVQLRCAKGKGDEARGFMFMCTIQDLLLQCVLVSTRHARAVSTTFVC